MRCGQVKESLFAGDQAMTGALEKVPKDGGLAVQTLVLKRFPDLRPPPVRITSPMNARRSTATLAPAFAQLTVNTSAMTSSGKHPTAAVIGAESAASGFGSEPAVISARAPRSKPKRTRTPSFRRYSNSPAHVRSRVGPSPQAGQVSTLHAVPSVSRKTTSPATPTEAAAQQKKSQSAESIAARRRRARPRFRARSNKAQQQSADPPPAPARRATTTSARGKARGKASGKPKQKPKRTEPRRWTVAEDTALRAAVSRHDEKNWKAIAQYVPGRNHVQCLQRWKKVLRPGLVKGHWTGEEDNKLRVRIGQGFKNWTDVSKDIVGRTPKQCRERWCNHLDPRIKKGAWSPLENEALVEAQAYLGKKWAQISKYLPGRTENAVKIRWKSLTRRSNSRGHDAQVLNDLLRTTQAAVARHKQSAAARADPATVVRDLVLDDAGEPLLNVDGTGYGLSAGYFPVAPGTSSDRFSPFPPRGTKDSVPHQSVSGRPQPLNVVESHTLPATSAIVKLAVASFSKGASTVRVALGGGAGGGVGPTDTNLFHKPSPEPVVTATGFQPGVMPFPGVGFQFPGQVALGGYAGFPVANEFMFGLGMLSPQAYNDASAPGSAVDTGLGGFKVPGMDGTERGMQAAASSFSNQRDVAWLEAALKAHPPNKALLQEAAAAQAVTSAAAHATSMGTCAWWLWQVHASV